MNLQNDFQELYDNIIRVCEIMFPEDIKYKDRFSIGFNYNDSFTMDCSTHRCGEWETWSNDIENQWLKMTNEELIAEKERLEEIKKENERLEFKRKQEKEKAAKEALEKKQEEADRIKYEELKKKFG